MNIEIKNKNGIKAAFAHSDEIIITDVQSALDFIMTIQYEHSCERAAILKSNINEDFFKLSTGIAGEILQKFTTYKVKLAIIGDFSIYTSKPLRDFIYECNKGNQIFFVENQDKALDMLTSH